MATENDLVRILIVVVAVVVLLPVLMMALMMPMMGVWGWGHMADGGMWGNAGGTWMWILMWVVMLAVVGSVGYLIYRLVRRSAKDVSDPALEELRAAYARGDLSDDEFERRRERLKRD